MIIFWSRKMSKILKYKCPDCGSLKLLMIQGIVKGYPVEEITEDDDGVCMVDTTGEEVDVHTNHVDTTYAYHCGGCGNTLLDDNVNELPVQEDAELVEWVKKNCEQE
jgi:predicted RNA-binding Zn-ribbon protein involved in translation (DUF1610 family)